MGIFCEINIHKSSDGTLKPGSIVSGAIKYAVDEETKVNKITITLKGIGKLRVEERINNTSITYNNNETYVNVDNVVADDEKGLILPKGMYETHFNFTLPENVPSSLRFLRNGQYKIICVITYYIRIKFDRPGYLKFAKRFKKVFVVSSDTEPKFIVAPTVHGGQKTLTQLFSKKPSTVNIKATSPGYVIKPGEKIKFDYEVTNSSNVKIKAIDMELVELYTFHVNSNWELKKKKAVEGTCSKSAQINDGVTKNMSVEIVAPLEAPSLEYSNIVSREYAVCLTVELPMPHRNLKVDVPVQISNYNLCVDLEKNMSGNFYAPPPSYWEVMCEEEHNNED